MRPPIQAGALRSVPVLLRPEASAAVVPLVSSSLSQLRAAVAAVIVTLEELALWPEELPAAMA